MEQPLREQIPRLRTALLKAKSSGNGAVADAAEPAPAVAENLVKPSRPNPAVEIPQPAG
jgi:hypothetical protein